MKRFTVVLALLVCAAARGDERFLIERIDVRHLVHASADVIRSESRLREGQTYGESDLRAASDRVKRLPFVLDAAFSLERGSVRDAYVLVITVNETRPIFFQLDTVPYFVSRNVVRAIDDDALFGGRWFAGKRGVFHGAAIIHQDDRPFESSYLALQAGYTQYGLFNDRAFATVTLSRYAPTATGAKGGTLPGALVGISLTPNQTLTMSYTAIGGDVHRRSLRVFETRLAYNTTNHPYFPSEGTLVSVAPIAAWIDGVDHTIHQKAFHNFETALEAHAARYWTLNPRLTASAVLDGGVVHIDGRTGGADYGLNVKYGTATLRLLRAIGDTSESDRRIELMLRGVTRHREVVAFIGDTKTETSIAWVRRNSWGVLRLGVGYTW